MGLGHFDGREWTTTFDAERFFQGRGLLDNRVATLACETNGWIWIGHGEAGLGATRFRGTEWQYVSMKEGLPSDDVYRVRCDEEGGAWLATGQGGCYVNGDRRVGYRPVSELADNHVVAVRMAANRLVAVQTVTGTAWFERGERLIEAAVPAGVAFLPPQVFAVPRDARIAGIRDVAPRVRVKTADGRNWLGTRDEGLLCLDGGTWRRVRLNGMEFPREITCLLEEAPGVLWVGTAAEGAIRIELNAGGNR
jgi:ligand-binding sensor domain-containing protein